MKQAMLAFALVLGVTLLAPLAPSADCPVWPTACDVGTPTVYQVSDHDCDCHFEILFDANTDGCFGGGPDMPYHDVFRNCGNGEGWVWVAHRDVIEPLWRDPMCFDSMGCLSGWYYRVVLCCPCCEDYCDPPAILGPISCE